MRWHFTVQTALLLGAMVAAHGADAPPAGRLLASQCFQCHGTQGLAVGDIDSLAGETADEIYDELLEMKYRAGNHIMVAHALGYSDAELLKIAQFLSTLPAGQSSGDNHAGDQSSTHHEDQHDERD